MGNAGSSWPVDAEVGDATMPTFRVVCFDINASKSAEHRDVEAQDEREAAERVCGGSLVDAGKPGQLRAQIAPTANPAARKMFYARD